MKVLKIIGWICIGLAGLSALALALGFPVMWLWNWLMPSLFGLPHVTFLQAVGLLLLCHLLFRGPSMGRHGKPLGRHSRDPRARIAQRVREHLGRSRDAAAETTGSTEAP
jgi:hypothetical protein